MATPTSNIARKALSAPSAPTAPPTARQGVWSVLLVVTLFVKSVVALGSSALALAATLMVGIEEVLHVEAIAKLMLGVATGHVGHASGDGVVGVVTGCGDGVEGHVGQPPVCGEKRHVVGVVIMWRVWLSCGGCGW